MKSTLIIIPILFLVFSCDDPGCPYEDERLCDPNFVPTEDVTLGNPDGTLVYDQAVFTEYESSVLLEDFTGYRCSNCLPALELADDLGEEWGDRIVVVAYHVFPEFAAPLTTDPSLPFYHDFRTSNGEELAISYLIPALPNGMVNRTDFGSGRIQGSGNWTDRVEEEMNEFPRGFIDIRDVSFDEVTELYNFNVAVKPLVQLNQNWNLVIGIYENGLIEGQKDGPETLYPYEHNHVFRRNVGGTFGDVALTPDQSLGTNEALFYSLAIELDPEWDPSNCYIFAYLIEPNTPEEIIACEKEPISP